MPKQEIQPDRREAEQQALVDDAELDAVGEACVRNDERARLPDEEDRFSAGTSTPRTRYAGVRRGDALRHTPTNPTSRTPFGFDQQDECHVANGAVISPGGYSVSIKFG